MAEKVRFPLQRAYPIPSVKNHQDFIKRYDQIFDKEFVKKIIFANPAKDWTSMGWRGIMFANGDVWLNYEDGKLLTVNYDSPFEKKYQKQLIQKDRDGLHPSIREYKLPVIILTTTQLRIRIDDLGKGNYRYTSWSINAKKSSPPINLLVKGERIPDGNGGNHFYLFKQGDYKYEVYISVIGKSSTPQANLSVYKKGKRILNVNAKRVEP